MNLRVNNLVLSVGQDLKSRLLFFLVVAGV